MNKRKRFWKKKLQRERERKKNVITNCVKMFKKVVYKGLTREKYGQRDVSKIRSRRGRTYAGENIDDKRSGRRRGGGLVGV